MFPNSISQKLVIEYDQGGIPTWGIPFSPYTVNVLLTGGAEEIILVPTGYSWFLIGASAGSNIIAKLDDGVAVALPTGVQSIGTAQINPQLRPCIGAPGIRIICDADAYVYVSFYNIKTRV